MKKLLFIFAFMPIVGISQIGFIYRNTNQTHPGEIRRPIEISHAIPYFLSPDSISQKPDALSNLKLATMDIYLRDSCYGYNFTSLTDSSFFYRSYRSYDQFRNETSFVAYTWDYTNHKWDDSIKDEYTFDPNGKQTLHIHYNVNKNTNQWVGFSKSENAYNANGGEVLSASYNWDTTANQWIGISKYEYTYDVNNNQTSSIYFNWDKTINQWTLVNKSFYFFKFLQANNKVSPDSTLEYNYTTPMDSVLTFKVDYYYDANGIDTLFIEYDFNTNTNTWVGSFKTKYFYDTNGNDTMIVQYQWDIATNQWDNYYKFQYKYNSNGNEAMNVQYLWNIATNQWVNALKYEFNYDINSNQTLYAYYNWNTATNQWIGIYKTENSFDTNNNEISNAYYNWDLTTNQWIGYYKDVYTFDKNNIQTINTYYIWDLTMSNWEFNRKYYYFNSAHNPINGISQLNFGMVVIYPNPTKETINIKTNNNTNVSCQLFNANGQMVKIMVAAPGINTYNIGNLKAGIYIIRIPTQFGLITSKLIKE